jgi:hypothetical protein
MTLEQLFQSLGPALVVAGPVVLHIVRMEHRLTKLETVLQERLPPKVSP